LRRKTGSHFSSSRSSLTKAVIKSSNDRNAVVVPIMSLEELPHLTTEERATLISELEKT
jgi:hypothetical protein